MTKDTLTTIGSTARIDFPTFQLLQVPAKIDTGADLSAIWVSNITFNGGKLQFSLFGQGSPFYTGEIVTVPASGYQLATIVNSFGQKEQRPKLKLNIVVQNRHIRATFSLADRSQKLYPVLLGKRMLQHKFLVDVSQGQPLPPLVDNQQYVEE